MTVRRPRRRPGENRLRLLEAGLIEFGLFGYHGASTTSIAHRAEVPQPHVYTNFGSKQELFLACWEFVHDSVQQNLGLVGASEAAFFYQTVASVRDRDLVEKVRGDLRELRTVLSEDRFSVLLASGASQLLAEDE
ncbi:TetR/AcrR family transcriptional regulator [Leucobacter sp. GX24907]